MIRLQPLRLFPLTDTNRREDLEAAGAVWLEWISDRPTAVREIYKLSPRFC